MQLQASSGSDGDVQSAMVNEKKRKRMESNRESARRSRMRKRQQLEDLTKQLSKLQIEKGQLLQAINDKTQEYINAAIETKMLRTQGVELIERLMSLNALLQKQQEVTGRKIDIPDIPAALCDRWSISPPVEKVSMPAMDTLEVPNSQPEPWLVEEEDSEFAMGITEIPNSPLPCPVEENGKFAIDITEMPNSPLEPWQLSWLELPMMASPYMFEC